MGTPGTIDRRRRWRIALMMAVLFLGACSSGVSGPPPTPPEQTEQPDSTSAAKEATVLPTAGEPATAVAVTQPADPVPPVDTAPQEESAAASAEDWAWRPSPDFLHLWEPAETLWDLHEPPNPNPGGWWVHRSLTPLPAPDGAELSFVQWRGQYVVDPWAVYAVVERSGHQVYMSPRLGDELTWYQVVTREGIPGFAVVVGTYHHAGQREWLAGTAVIPYTDHFGPEQLVPPGLYGGSLLTSDQSGLRAWAGQWPDIEEDGEIVNCLMCPQHMTVTPFTWDGWTLVEGESYRTRGQYQIWELGAGLEDPPQSAEP